jgi:uncharacterized protein (DUF4415 family)
MRQTIKTRAGRVLEVPTDDEDAAITAAALSDPDNPPLTDSDFKVAKRGKGRPKGSNKEQVNIRLDVDVLEAFKAEGSGWQTRINNVLREWVRHH